MLVAQAVTVAMLANGRPRTVMLWGWAHFAGYILGEKGLSDYPHVKRLVDEISVRPAAIRALALKDRQVFKAEFDEETRRALFPQNASLAV